MDMDRLSELQHLMGRAIREWIEGWDEGHPILAVLRILWHAFGDVSAMMRNPRQGYCGKCGDWVYGAELWGYHACRLASSG